MRSIPMAVACLALVTACASKPAPDLAALGQQILAAEAAEAAAWAARDVDKIMNSYAADTQVLIGKAPIDREALRGLFVEFLKDPGFTLTFRSDPPLVAGAGDVGVAVGTYEVTFSDAATQTAIKKTGHHLITWKLQEDGQWRIVRQMTRHDT